MIKLIAGKRQDAYNLRLRFSDGCRGIYDFAHFVDAATEMTAPLRDPDYFADISSSSALWPGPTAST